MSKQQNVIKYYILCNKLKDLIRTGWLNWNVKRDRLESVAEHIYGVQQLAIAMKHEYNYDIDLLKVIYMLAIHELFSNLLDGETIEALILEFDERKTPEAQFAYQCDKLECDLQSKLYDEENCVDLNEQKENDTLKNEKVQQLLNSGMSWGKMWLTFGQQTYPYDENFRSVSQYAKDNTISLKK